MTAELLAWPWRGDLVVAAFAALARIVGDDPDEPTERDWIARARRGDDEAARQLYRAHVARVFRTVRPLCRDDAEAEDVTQETFVRALEALDRYQAREGSRFVSWLLTIAMNVARKALRRRKRTVEAEPERTAAAVDRAIDVRHDDAAETLDAAKLRAALLRAMETLDARQREIVALRYGGELSAREIADQLGLEHANVRKIAERARDALRSHIEAALAPARPIAEEDRA